MNGNGNGNGDGTNAKGTLPGHAGPGVGTPAGDRSPVSAANVSPASNRSSGYAGHAGDLPPGTLLGKYQVVRQLGSGGMGAVYEAVHTSINKPVALKTMNPALASDPRAEARFMREAAAASRLAHPNVCDVTDFGSDAGVVYIVMELMRGEDLSALVSHAPAGLDFSFVADVMLAVCAGVFAAHEKGVVHRDLKPQNIFLSRTAMGDVVPKVLDFGISKLLDEEAAGALTNSGSVMGTTHYLSPEQVMGLAVDGRSDEFALGVILYECLTGQRPHGGDTIFTIMRAISEGRFQRPRALRPDLPPAFEAIVLRAMALRPDDRFPTVHALGNGLLGFASPKGRVMWSDYFSRAPASAMDLGQGAGAAHAQAFAATPTGRSGQAGSMGPGPTMMIGQPQVGNDTRSGVGPVSVWGTGEIDQTASPRRNRGPLYALGGAAIAAVAFFVFKPTILPRTDTSEGKPKRAEIVPHRAEATEKPGAKRFGAGTGLVSETNEATSGDRPVPESGAQKALEQLEQNTPTEPPALDPGRTDRWPDIGPDSRRDRATPAARPKTNINGNSRATGAGKDNLPWRRTGPARPTVNRPRPPAVSPRPSPDQPSDATDDLLGGQRSRARPESVPILD